MAPPAFTSALLFLGFVSINALLLCPYSKVEESFGMQATHDLYYYGITPMIKSLRNEIRTVSIEKDHKGYADEPSIIDLPYDHLKYPGVVPRTFLGPLILATISRVVGVALSPFLNLAMHPNVVQLVARSILLLFHLHAFARLATSVSTRFGDHKKLIGTYFLIITSCQFHIPFYMSRTLPNIFALILVVHSYADWFQGSCRRAAFLIVVATCIFRCDLLILLFTVGLAMLLRREISVVEALITGISAGIVSIVVSVPLDSMLWKMWIWPEAMVLFFNTVENKSSEWGTEAWHWYFSRALPRAMLLSSFLVPLAFLRIPEIVSLWESRKTQKKPPSLLKCMKEQTLVDLELLPFLAPVLAFVALYSILPHKEMRFIFPALPMLNIAAGQGLARLHRSLFLPYETGKDKLPQKKRLFSFAFFLFGLGTLIVTFIGSSVFLAVSRENYPGGEALAMLQDNIEKGSEDINIYIDVAAAMSGVTLFGQRAVAVQHGNNGRFLFTKAGYEHKDILQSGNLSDFAYLLSENKSVDGFHVTHTARGFPRVDLKRFRIATEDAIFVLEKDK